MNKPKLKREILKILEEEKSGMDSITNNLVNEFINDIANVPKNNQSFYRAVVTSDKWREWEEVAQEKGFDWSESVECGWLSDEHFSAFLNWIKINN